MQSKACRQLTTELEIGGKTAAEIVLQDFLDRITAERQLHQLRQHLETGQGFLKRTIGPDQTQAVNNIALRTEAADGGQHLCILDG